MSEIELTPEQQEFRRAKTNRATRGRWRQRSASKRSWRC
jgi:hypothetical protein